MQRRSENRDRALKCTSSAPKSSSEAVGEPDAPTWKHVCSFCSTKAAWSLPCTFETAVSRRRSYQVMRKPFPSFETFLLRGSKQTLTLLQNDMWSMFERPSRNIANHLSEGTTHLLKNGSSTAECLTVHLYKDSASTAGIQALDVEERALLRSKSKGQSPRASHESVPRDPLRRMCSALQQGHFLP